MYGFNVIQPVKKFFVYTHIRIDKEEIFYVGIGTQPKNGLLYQRAYTDYGRNPTWKAIARISNYYVKIVLEADTREEVEAEEKRLIALYGRRDIKTGILANRTDGGEKVKAPGTKKKKNASKKLNT